MSFTDYMKETRSELKRVSWPTRQQAIAYTVLVIAIAIVLAAYLGFFDYLFSTILEKYVL